MGGVSVILTEAAEKFVDAGTKTEAAEDDHEPGLGVKPAVEKITEETAGYRRSDQEKWQLRSEGVLAEGVACAFR